jgi:hypothetical protein
MQYIIIILLIFIAGITLLYIYDHFKSKRDPDWCFKQQNKHFEIWKYFKGYK